MLIKILGTDCSKCERLERNLNIALEELDIDADIEKIGDLLEIVSYGVMDTPGFVINDEVKSTGKALSVKQIKKILK